MSDTRQRIQDDIKAAMKARDRTRLGTLRLMASAIKQREVDERITLDDDDVIAILDRMGKQRRESIRQYSDAGRDDLVAVEQAELDIIADYMPAALSETDIERLIQAAIERTGADSVRDMGKVMAEVKPAVQGRADMSAVSQQIRQQLAGH